MGILSHPVKLKEVMGSTFGQTPFSFTVVNSLAFCGTLPTSDF